MQDYLKPLNISYLKEKAENDLRKTTVKRARNILTILEKNNYKCVQCGSKDNLTIEHPFGRKFAKHDNHVKYKPDKCTVLCVDCHLKKNALMEKKSKVL